MKKRRDTLFADVRETYNNYIKSCNVTYDTVGTYINTYVNIATIFEVMDVRRSEVKFKLGEEFDKWFFEDYRSIIESMKEEI